MTKNRILKRHPLALAVFTALNLTPMAYAVGTDIVISEFRTRGPSGGNDEFVELYNLSASPVNIGGWKINGSNNAGTTSTRATVPANTTINPGCRFLATNNGASGYSGAVPGNQTYATGLTDDGGVALLNASNVIIDAVGMSNGSAYKEGIVLTPTTTNAERSQERKPLGRNNQDSDNNANDFALNAGTSNPQNLASSCTTTTPTVNLSVSTNAGSEASATVINVTATVFAPVTSDQSVTLAVTGAGITAGDYTLSNAAITIPNGGTTGSVTFTVMDDALAEGTETATLTIGSPSAGISLGATTAQAIVITDNETAVLAGSTVTQSGGTTNVAEGGANDSYTVVLNSQPAANVTVSAAADGQVTANPSLLIFTQANWNVPQSVTVTAVDDTIFEGAHTGFVSHSVSSSDANYNGIAIGAITAGITDNDTAPGNACGDPATKISAVQGSGASTPLSGSTSIEGIVVGDYQGDNTNSLRGFFVQEEDVDADGNPATSEGIFVFDGTAAQANVSVGDRVRVTGTPAEFFNMTQLSTVTNVQVCAVNQVIPAAATLTLPVPNVPNGNLTTATDAINAYYEAFEGMMVKVPATLKVSEYFELERYGQLLLTQGGRIPTFTNVNNPGTSGLINHEIMLAKRQIILDDGNNIQNFYISSFAASNSIPLPYPSGGLSTTNRFRGGDTISNLTGVLHWSFAGQSGTDAWRIRPVEELFDYTFTSANPRKNTSPDVSGTLKVASFNVLNYFTTIDLTPSNSSGPCGPDGIQDCRGADSAAELTRQTAKAAAAICGMNADIVGLMEIENNADASLSSLVTAANAINGCGPYAYVNTGIIGGDAIKVGLLYKTTTVNPEGGFEVLNSNVDVRFIDTKNRPALAQTFSQISSGEKLTVAVNHLKSKGSDCNTTSFGGVFDVDNNDGQGHCNQTRKNAALALVDWINSDPTNSGDPDYLIIGDLNSYAKEDPIKAIENGPDHIANTVDDYTNLVKAFGGDAAYSYVFDGQTGYLDHALANNTLLQQVTRTADWHINADEAPSFDYNDTIKDTGEAAFEARPAALPLSAVNPFRTSDHDPVIIGLRLGETINIIEGTAARNTLNGSAGKDRITGLGSPDTLTGGASEDEFVYVTTADGIDTITDFTPGEDKIVLTALLQSLGYQGANPLAEGVVKFATSGSNTIVYIDADGAGPAVIRALVVVNNVSFANLNNAANFIF